MSKNVPPLEEQVLEHVRRPVVVPDLCWHAHVDLHDGGLQLGDRDTEAGAPEKEEIRITLKTLLFLKKYKILKMKTLQSEHILISTVGINSIVFFLKKKNYDKAYVREIAFFARKI